MPMDNEFVQKIKWIMVSSLKIAQERGIKTSTEGTYWGSKDGSYKLPLCLLGAIVAANGLKHYEEPSAHMAIAKHFHFPFNDLIPYLIEAGYEGWGDTAENWISDYNIPKELDGMSFQEAAIELWNEANKLGAGNAENNR